MTRHLLAAAALGFAVIACSAQDVGQSTDAVDYICSESPAATLDGIPAYAYCKDTNVWSDNGVDTKSASGGTGWVQTEGGYGYQCVEYAVRYSHFKFGTATGWGISYAKQMCATHPSSMSVTTKPVHGDLIIFAGGSCGADPTAGHVAVVDTVGASTIVAVQENTAGKYTYNTSCASCFLHDAKNTGSTDPCVTAPSDGLYCGQSPQFGGGTKDDLYDCEGGATKTKTVCSAGCIVESPGTNDKCAPEPDAGADAATADAAPSSDSGTKEDAALPISEEDAGTPTTSSGACTIAPGSSNAPRPSIIVIAFAFALGVTLARRKPRT